MRGYELGDMKDRLSDLDARTDDLINELFGEVKKPKKSEKKQIFDIDKQTRQKLDDFNKKFDTTMIQMGDESE